MQGYPLYLFGHVGDGNLHLNVLKPDEVEKETFLETCRNAEPAIFELIRSFRQRIRRAWYWLVEEESFAL